MNNIKHNLNFEKQILKLFDFNLVGPINFNHWDIYDNESKIGYIQYINSNYEIKVDNGRINFHQLRNEKETSNYEILINFPQDSEEVDSLKLYLGKYFGLLLHSKKYGYMSFYLNNEVGFSLNFKSETERYKTEETVLIQNLKNKNYSYSLSHCLKNENLSDPKTLNISFNVNEQNIPMLKNKYAMRVSTYQNHKYQLSYCEYTNIFPIIEIIEKQEFGINAFNHFRYLINEITPCKNEIISTLLENEVLNKEEYTLFLPDIPFNDTQILTLKRDKKTV